jgi:hypothetical protein
VDNSNVSPHDRAPLIEITVFSPFRIACATSFRMKGLFVSTC